MSSSLRILDEDVIWLEQVSADLKISMQTARRFCGRGLEFLKTAGTGGRILTSRQAVARYLAKVNGIDPDAPDAVQEAPARSKRRQKELAGVDRYLDSELGRNDQQRTAAREG
jgi:hypothetical protein